MKRPRPPHHDGVASSSESHCQLSNCIEEIIEISSTGTDSAALMISRVRRRSGWVLLGRLVGLRLGARQCCVVADGLDGRDQLLDLESRPACST